MALQVFLKATTVGLVSFTVVIETILFCSGRCRIVSDWSQAPDSWLVLDGIKDLVDREVERSALSA